MNNNTDKIEMRERDSSQTDHQPPEGSGGGVEDDDDEQVKLMYPALHRQHDDVKVQRSHGDRQRGHEGTVDELSQEHFPDRDEMTTGMGQKGTVINHLALGAFVALFVYVIIHLNLLQSDLSTQQQQISQQNQLITALNLTISDLQHTGKHPQLSLLQQHISELQKTVTHLTLLTAGLKQQLSEQTQNMTDLNQQIMDQTQQLSELKHQVSGHNKLVSHLYQNVSWQQEELSRVASQLSRQENTTSDVITTLTRLKHVEHGTISCKHPVLSNGEQKTRNYVAVTSFKSAYSRPPVVHLSVNDVKGGEPGDDLWYWARVENVTETEFFVECRVVDASQMVDFYVDYLTIPDVD